MTTLQPSTDPQVMRLAHPNRLSQAMSGFYVMIQQLLGAEWPIVERYLKEERWVIAEAGYQLTSQHPLPKFKTLVQALSGMEGNTEQGGVYAILSWVRYQLVHYTFFKFDDGLVDLLEQTDIDDDIPISYLIPPYPYIYLELGEQRCHDSYILNAATGKHLLEGAYVERATHRECGDCLYITLTGSPEGHLNASDDATVSVLLPLADLDQPLSEVVEQAFYRQRAEARAMGLALSSEAMLEASFAALKTITKALLYLSLPEARKTLHAERTQLLKAGEALKSSAKKAKHLRKAAKVYDYILVQAPVGENREPGPGSGSRSVKPHWRRGHYRLQAHGPQSSLRKLVFIRPMLIGGDHVSGNETPGVYRVR